MSDRADLNLSILLDIKEFSKVVMQAVNSISENPFCIFSIHEFLRTGNVVATIREIKPEIRPEGMRLVGVIVPTDEFSSLVANLCEVEKD